jgi:hypothetical protein
MRSLAAFVLAAAAAAAPAQTLEQRAAEVLRTMSVPSPVETVIQSGTIAGPAGQAMIGTPAVQTQAGRSMTQLLETPNTTLAPQQSTGIFTSGTALVNDPRGTATLGAPPGMLNSRGQVYMPGLVVYPANGGGASVSGASNLTIGPRSFVAGDGGNP